MNDSTLWVRKAEIDFKAAVFLKDSGLWDVACYHFQQSSEKYLKSLLVSMGVNILRTHDLSVICNIIYENGINVDTILQSCTDLTFFATATRYPGYDASEEDTANCLYNASVIRDFVLAMDE